MGNQVLKLNKSDTVLVVIDYQERIMPAMKSIDEFQTAGVKLIKGCRILDVPILITQQYTKGLGETIPSVKAALTETLGEDAGEAEFLPIEKTSFSAMGEPEFVETIQKLGRKTVIICGIEAHVCVQQTVIDLLEKGYTVFIANDCISSRSNNDKKHAQRRMSDAGAVGSTMEAILFELLKGAKEPGFKQISALVK